MLGDSYMDLGNVGPTIMKDANNAMYRHYYLLGSAMNYGSGQLNIPYQWDTMALNDTAVAMPKDVKVVIMDGGGNDVLIDNSQCLTTPTAGDTACHTAIDASVMKGQSLEMDMVAKGVQHIVYYFYPHLDPTVGGHTYANDWLDYSYPKGAASCCGAGNVPSSGDITCRGNGQGADCVWIDTRPEFMGHNDHTNASSYWFQSDGIHPSQPGADAIATKVWAKMQEYCIAQ
jgi:lysophospholipase L1-like esterase